MNLKTIISWIFVGSLGLLLLSGLLAFFVDCSTPNTGIWVGLNSQKSSLCGFIKILKDVAFIALIAGATISLINYFVFKDNGENC